MKAIGRSTAPVATTNERGRTRYNVLPPRRDAGGRATRRRVQDELPSGAADECGVMEDSSAALGEFGDGRRYPRQCRLPFDAAAFEFEFAAAHRLAFAQHDACARPGGGAGSRKSRRAAAGDEHVAGQILDRGRRQLAGAGRGAESGEPSDERLVGAPLRPDESLVVEARAEETAARLKERSEVEGERRPAVLAAQHVPLPQHQRRRGNIGDDGRAVPTVNRPLGSSGPAASTPRRRRYLTLRPKWRTPPASNAEAAVSPGWPRYSRPS